MEAGHVATEIDRRLGLDISLLVSNDPNFSNYRSLEVVYVKVLRAMNCADIKGTSSYVVAFH